MFEEARRSQTHIKIGLAGPSGSGKTMSSLLIAYGLVGDWSKIGLVCSEGGSGELYANYSRNNIHIGRYKIHKLKPPFEPQKYINAINAAIDAGLECIILDTISHAWAGTGGLLDKRSRLADTAKFNSFTAWRMITPEHNKFVDAMVQSQIHLIATLRTKTEWIIVEDEKGKTRPQKIGLTPIQRGGMEYEFTIVFDLSQDHFATVSKDRTGLFDGKVFMPTPKTGREILDWLRSAETKKEEAEEEENETKFDTAEPGNNTTDTEEVEFYNEDEAEDETEGKVEDETGKNEEVKVFKIRLGKKANYTEYGSYGFRTAQFPDNTVGWIASDNETIIEKIKNIKSGKYCKVTGVLLSDKEKEEFPKNIRNKNVLKVLEIKEIKQANIA